MNNISFQGNFQISNNLREKFAYRQVLSEKMENILTEKFQQTTKNIPYTLELTNVNPITKYTFLILKVSQKFLNHRYSHALFALFARKTFADRGICAIFAPKIEEYNEFSSNSRTPQRGQKYPLQPSGRYASGDRRWYCRNNPRPPLWSLGLGRS